MSTVRAMTGLFLSRYDFLSSALSSSTSSSDKPSSGSTSSDTAADLLANGVTSPDILSQAETALTGNRQNARLKASQNSALRQLYSDAQNLSQSARSLSSSINSYGLTDTSAGSTSNITPATVENLVASYNNLVKYASANTQYISSDALNGMLRSIGDCAGSLEAIGITTNADGTLSVNESALSNAIENDAGAVQTALVGSGGLARNLYLASQSITQSSVSRYETVLFSAGGSSANLYNYICSLNKSDFITSLLGSIFSVSA